jgi:hypothetical protein
VALMKAASVADQRGSIPPPAWQRWWQSIGSFASWQTLAGGPALAVGLAICVAIFWMAPALVTPGADSVQSVSLSALRGGDLSARARAGLALQLKFSDHDIAGASVSIVRANGDPAWSGRLDGNTVAVSSLPKGLYWIRLTSASSGEQIKEYGLTIE